MKRNQAVAAFEAEHPITKEGGRWYWGDPSEPWHRASGFSTREAANLHRKMAAVVSGPVYAGIVQPILALEVAS